jgi:hypothetical protein
MKAPMNRRDRKSSPLIFLFCLLCYSLQPVTGTQATIIAKDSIPFLMEKLEKNSIRFSYPIFRVYELSNNSRKDFLFLTEHPYDTVGRVIMNDSIQAFCIGNSDGKYSQKWSLKDFIIKNPNNHAEESTIWFWSKYICIEDIDQDGITDFIVVYGTKGLNGIDDGRLKILVYYKNHKFAVRHQNGVLDFERQTQIDSSIYGLPERIQESVIVLIQSIIKDGHAIFASDWKKSFENNKTLIKEENQKPPPKKEARKKNQNGQHILQQR